jgi:hypothetical protein
MRALLDENIPHGLRKLLPEHEVFTVAYMGWAGMKNGKLLKAAEEAGFDVIIISDHSIPYQQNMTGRKLALLMLSTADWNILKLVGGRISAALATVEPGSFARVECGNFRRPRRKPQAPGLG